MPNERDFAFFLFFLVALIVGNIDEILWRRVKKKLTEIGVEHITE